MSDQRAPWNTNKRYGRSVDKKLEPTRHNTYGPYDGRLPKDAGADTVPPWWPPGVRYMLPARLPLGSEYTTVYIAFD
jgi:hypothetical protein